MLVRINTIVDQDPDYERWSSKELKGITVPRNRVVGSQSAEVDDWGDQHDEQVESADVVCFVCSYVRFDIHNFTTSHVGLFHTGISSNQRPEARAG